MKTRRWSCTVVALLVALAPLVPQSGATGGATLTFRKVFKSSSPEYVEIKVNERGGGTYDIRQLNDPPSPQPFEVSPGLAARMFALAGKLDDFRDVHLDVRRRIANLGLKTFRYERGGESYETSFNYTLDATANQLLQMFEGLSRQQEHADTLERTMRYDRLGVNDALLQLEYDLNRKLVPEPKSLLPILERIAADARFVDIARERARALATRIRSTK